MEDITDGIIKLNLPEMIRFRPVMFFGSRGTKGVLGLFDEFLTEILALLNDQESHIEITIKNEKAFRVVIQGRFDINEIVSRLETATLQVRGRQYLAFLIAASETMIFNISGNIETREMKYTGGVLQSNSLKTYAGADGLEMDFELSDDVFIKYPDYHKFSSLCCKFAMLNSKSKFTLQDINSPHLNKNFYHFPNGLKSLFDDKVSEVHAVVPITFISEYSGANYYEIGIAVKADQYYWHEDIISYAGNNVTKENGSLVDGIINGVIGACVKFVKPLSKATGRRIKKSTLQYFREKLVITCLIRTPDHVCDYAGASKWALIVPEIEKEVSELVSKKVLVCFNNDSELVEKLKELFEWQLHK